MNEPAIQLYKAAGFQATSRRADYYRVGRSALAMELDLVVNERLRKESQPTGRT